MSSSLSGTPAAPSNCQSSSPRPGPDLLSSREPFRAFERHLDSLFRFNGPCLQIHVGQDERKETFWIHQNLLQSRSEFFKRAAKDEWLPDSDRVVLLPDDEPVVFQTYVALTYSGAVPHRDWLTTYGDLAKVYVLAEKLQDTWAKNHIIDAMHNHIKLRSMEISSSLEKACKVGSWLEPSVVDDLYEGTPAESPARRLVVDFVVEHGTAQWLDPADFLLLHPEFLFEITIRLLKDRSSVLSTKKLVHPSTHYHEELEVKPRVSETSQAKNMFGTSKASPAGTQTVWRPTAQFRLPQSLEQAPGSSTVPRYNFSFHGGGISRT